MLGAEKITASATKSGKTDSLSTTGATVNSAFRFRRRRLRLEFWIGVARMRSFRRTRGGGRSGGGIIFEKSRRFCYCTGGCCGWCWRVDAWCDGFRNFEFGFFFFGDFVSHDFLCGLRLREMIVEERLRKERKMWVGFCKGLVMRLRLVIAQIENANWQCKLNIMDIMETRIIMPFSDPLWDFTTLSTFFNCSTPPLPTLLTWSFVIYFILMESKFVILNVAT